MSLAARARGEAPTATRATRATAASFRKRFCFMVLLVLPFEAGGLAQALEDGVRTGQLDLQAAVREELLLEAVDAVPASVLQQARVVVREVDVGQVVGVDEVRVPLVLVVEHRSVHDPDAAMGAQVLEGAEADGVVQGAVLELALGEPVDLGDPAAGGQQVLQALALLVAAEAPAHALFEELVEGALGDRPRAGDIPDVVGDPVFQPAGVGFQVAAGPGTAVPLPEEEGLLDALGVLDGHLLPLGHRVLAPEESGLGATPREVERSADDLREVVLGHVLGA